ncbi:MAG: flavin reductase family protein [Anaerolineae bacterium]|nr:flavin reductase family protein [Anaerolineae bacterium]
MPSFKTSDLTKKQSYNLITGAIVPRPIAWVSTISESGLLNLAPFSFFNGIAVMPPTLGFTVAYADDDRGYKDTYRNLMANRECVVNMVTDTVAHAMNITAKGFAPDVDEFEEAALIPIESELVQPPRVKESLIQFECTLNQVVTLKNEVGHSDLMLCNILMIHVDEAIYLGDYKIDQTAYPVIGRMGGSHYTQTNDLFDMTRYHKIDNTTEL